MPFVFSDLREEVRLTGPGIVSDLLVCRDHLRRFSLGLTSTFARAVGVDDHEPQDDALSSDACAKGTRTNHADVAIRKYAPRTFTGSSLVNPMTASARNARAADPTDGRCHAGGERESA